MSDTGETVVWAALAATSFLSGSIPFGLIISRAHGVNIREHGSGNIGATNVWRVLGKSAGLRCFILDVAKGLLPTLAAGFIQGLIGSGSLVGVHSAWWFGVGVAAVLGHMFSPWAGFRGGKGVATALGALLGIYPYLTIPTLASGVVWIAMVKSTRRVGISSCVAAVSVPGWLWLWSLQQETREGMTPFYVGTGLLAALVVFRHRGNLARTFAGTEPRIGDGGGGARGSDAQKSSDKQS